VYVTEDGGPRIVLLRIDEPGPEGVILNKRHPATLFIVDGATGRVSLGLGEGHFITGMRRKGQEALTSYHKPLKEA
jgi:hypothetical protein